MIGKVDHVAVVVNSLKGSLDAYRLLGLPVKEPVFFPEVEMNIAFAGEGASRVELVESAGPGSPVHGKPGGIHHIALSTPDIEETHQQLTEDTRFLVEGDIRQGAHSRVFFFRITGEEETLYECVEAAE